MMLSVYRFVSMSIKKQWLFIVVAACIQLLSLAVHAESAWLLLPEDFDVEAVNGEEFKKRFFQSSSVSKVPLQAGLSVQRMILKYSQVFDDGEDLNVVRSNSFQLQFSLPKGVEQLSVSFIKPKNYREAKVFSKKPLFEVLIDTVVSGQLSVGDKLPVDIIFTKNLVGSAPVIKPSQLPLEGKVLSNAQQIDILESPLDRLKRSWQEASGAERMEFLEFIK